MVHVKTVNVMSMEFLTPKQQIGKSLSAASKSPRHNTSETSLILALLIGACAATGIIIAAINDPIETASSVSPVEQLDSQR
jgi:hypothetical protein